MLFSWLMMMFLYYIKTAVILTIDYYTPFWSYIVSDSDIWGKIFSLSELFSISFPFTNNFIWVYDQSIFRILQKPEFIWKSHIFSGWKCMFCKNFVDEELKNRFTISMRNSLREKIHLLKKQTIQIKKFLSKIWKDKNRVDTYYLLNLH